MRAANKAGFPFAVLDHLVWTDRVAADRPFFSGKHHCHGMNLQVIAGPASPPWVSGALPGSVHDMKAAWIWGIEHELAAAGLPALADKGYQGAVHAKTPTGGRENRNRRKRPTVRTRNSWAPGERATPSSKHGRSLPSYLLPIARGPDRQGSPVLQFQETKAR